LQPDRSTDPRGRAAGTPLTAFWRALRRNRLALVGGIVVVCLVLLAILAPVIALWDPNRPDIKRILDAPSNKHPLGTDQLGRDVRAGFLALKEREFVIWSQAVGASGFRIVWRHILPNAMAPVLVAMTLGIPAAILTESGLSFLGLGVQPPHATWGNILNEGKDAIEIGWWLSLYPGLAILVTVLSYNLLGEGIRDALDPRLRQNAARFVSRAR